MATAKKLKVINTEKIRAELKTMELHTKNSLSMSTGLSIATCGNILMELLVTGEVIEIEQAESTGGRPSRQFVYNKDFANIVTLYIRKEGESKSAYYAVCNIIGEVLYEKQEEYTEIDIGVIDEIISTLVSKYPNVKSVAIGVPGVVKNGRIGICDFDLLKDFDIKKHYENKYDFDIFVINDVNCIAFGFYNKKSFSDNENIAYVYYPVHGGPGAGIIIDGKVILGESNFAGEVAFLPHSVLNDVTAIQNKDKLQLDESIFRTVLSINAILNPKSIILSGYQLNNEMIFAIKKLTEKYIPAPHVPEIELEEDIHESYLSGLIAYALDELTYKFNI